MPFAATRGRATILFRDDGEHTAPMNISMSVDELALAPNLAALNTSTQALITDIDPAIDGVIEEYSLTVHFTDTTKDTATDLLEGSLGSVSDQAVLQFQQANGKVREFKVKTPEEGSFLDNNNVDEQDGVIATMITSFITNVVVAATTQALGAIAEYIGGWRDRGKSRAPKKGVTQEHED